MVSLPTSTAMPSANRHVFVIAIDGSFCTSVDRKSGFDCGTASLTRVLSVSYGKEFLLILVNDRAKNYTFRCPGALPWAKRSDQDLQ